MKKQILFTLSLLSTLLLNNGANAAENGRISGSCESGPSVYRWTDGNRYEGQCLNNLFQGQGTLTLVNGDLYEGQFRDNQKNGRGVYFFSSADR
jgi:hypothetical protein